MQKVTYKDVTYDSKEELDIKHWLDEAFENGLIERYQKCEKGVDTFELIEKQYYQANGTRKHLFANVKYTPDFCVVGSDLIKEKPTEETLTFIDVKGSFSQHNDEKSFQLIRKMMYNIHGIFVHKVIPDQLFKKTWVPELCRYTKVKKDVQKKYRNTPTIKEYLNNQKKYRDTPTIKEYLNKL